MQGHRQVCAKVNAYVDEKIAPVIEAISKMPNIVTGYSCEDNRTDAAEPSIARAYITFHFKNERDNWKDLANVCNTLSEKIAEYTHSEVSVRWRGGKITAVFEFNTEDAYWLTLAINESHRDSQCTESGS